MCKPIIHLVRPVGQLRVAPGRLELRNQLSWGWQLASFTSPLHLKLWRLCKALPLVHLYLAICCRHWLGLHYSLKGECGQWVIQSLEISYVSAWCLPFIKKNLIYQMCISKEADRGYSYISRVLGKQVTEDDFSLSVLTSILPSPSCFASKEASSCVAMQLKEA